MTTKIKLVDIPCPVCGIRERKLLYKKTLQNELPALGYRFSSKHNQTYAIVKCLKCGHTYSSPRPKNIWQAYNISNKDEIYLQQETERIATAKKVIKIIRKFYSRGKILDVGCATGDFLMVAKKYYKVEGLEITKWSSQIARQRNLKIYTCDLKNLKGKNLYEIITLWGVIEHFEHPRQEIKQIFRLLKPEGIICLWTGNADSFLAKILGSKWWYIQGQHIQLFTKHSLQILLESEGFKKVWIGRYPYVLTRESIINSLKRYVLLGKIVKPLLRLLLPSNYQITFALKGEMFAIYKKESLLN